MLVTVLLSGVITVIADSDPAPARAVDAGLFDPGYIIADHTFYDSSSMTSKQVQSFLDGRVPTCRATTGPACLRFYTESTVDRAIVAGRCAAYTGSAKESGAMIIWKVGQACGISPKVLLVLLEKEQGLVSSSAPSAYKYRSATGFGCPDTAACDSRYYGFFNQVYQAALQFKRYAASPNGWSYRAGQTSKILYHPNSACGSKSVAIRNQATASLYIYTPYTPNAAALANLGGYGDSCSAYGNRNFWRLFTTWFGSTTGDGSPYGAVSAIVPGHTQVQVSGWAVDPDTSESIRAHVYIDGVGVANVPADIATPALASRMGSTRTNHGYSTVVPNVAPGSHNVCVFGINAAGSGSNTLLECRTVTVYSGSPYGAIDQTEGYTRTVMARGWAIDPDTNGAVKVRLRVGSTVVAEQVASGSKAGLGQVFPGYGDNHGFQFAVAGVAPGTHRVCVDVENVMAGSDTSLGCRTVTILAGSPLFHVDEASAKAPGQLTVRGWAIDPDVVDPVRIHLYVDGELKSKFTADTPKTSLSSAFHGYGVNHSFSTTVSDLSVGNHEVCMIAIGVGEGGNTAQCRTVSTPTGSPIIHIDQAAGTGIGVSTIRGWSIDPDITGAVQVQVLIDGKVSSNVTADSSKAGLNAAFPGYGNAHGFSVRATGIAPGQHTACVRAINLGGGTTTVQCMDFKSFAGSPALYIDEASPAGSSEVRLRGWAIDPDTVAPARIHVYVDGQLSAKFDADVVKDSLAEAFAPFGSAHAFDITLENISSGVRNVCVYAVNVGPGDTSSECRKLTVGY